MKIKKINWFTFLFEYLLHKTYGASNRFKLPRNIVMRFCKIHNDEVRKILQPYFNNVLSKIKKLSFKGHKDKKIIWMFWWQGMNNMPLIAKKCVYSVKHRSSGHKVILVDKHNVYKYTNIPNYIYRKVKQGKIDFTHFSDIVRFNLLRNHGGLWIDSTMYCASKLGPEYFNDYLYTSGGYQHTIPKFVHGRWIEGLIGGNKGNSMFVFMDEFNKLYWKFNNKIINYFMEDYGFEFIYKHNIGGFKDYTDHEASGNNPYLFKFTEILNKPYNPNYYKKVISTTNLLNLTYKRMFINNGKTYYSKILHDK